MKLGLERYDPLGFDVGLLLSLINGDVFSPVGDDEVSGCRKADTICLLACALAKYCSDLDLSKEDTQGALDRAFEYVAAKKKEDGAP